MAKEKEKPEPTFIDQAHALVDKKFKESEGIEDPRFGPGLRPFDHKLLCSIMDLQASHVNDILSEKYTEKIAEFYGPIMESLKKLDSIALDITDIKERLTAAEEKVNLEEQKIAEHEIRLNKKREVIKNLRDDFEQYKEDVKILAEVKPTLITIQNTFNWWKWKKHWLRNILIITGLILIFSGIVIGIYSIMRKSGWLSQSKPKTAIEQIWEDIETGNVSPTVRKADIDYSKLTESQRDSIHEINIQSDLRMIR
jgi:hypothetical protein